MASAEVSPGDFRKEEVLRHAVVRHLGDQAGYGDLDAKLLISLTGCGLFGCLIFIDPTAWEDKVARTAPVALEKGDGIVVK